jgi:hypothetical protein
MARVKKLSLLKTHRPALVPSQPLFNQYQGSFSGIKQPVHAVYSSPPFSAKVKNECTDRENFTFYFANQKLFTLC